MDNIKIISKVPTVEEYNKLRKSVGWTKLEYNEIKKD